MRQPVTVSSSACSQLHACTNKAFSSASTIFNPCFGWCYSFAIYFIPAKVGTYNGLNLVDVLENALFLHAFGYIILWLSYISITVTGSL